uniref:TSA: Wollemia nobilis Ref_Wollemi_Transcript_23155_1695 transcribed RNA sequence n=1 Tax=Wollemia nobilis TaxID=56998 RepID=A0A0C9RQK5_9CONI
MAPIAVEGEEGHEANSNNSRNPIPMNVSIHMDDTLRDSSSVTYQKPGFKEWAQKTLWHGGSNYDAWCNAVSGQVGQVILSMPYSYSQMGLGLGIFFHLLYAIVGIWTCYMLACLYMEYRARKEKEGSNFKKHVIQYHEVMGYLVGPWLRRASLFFNIITMGSVAVVQIIACASNAYYLNSKYNKREWAIIFGGISLLTILLPTFHNFRIWSIIGVLTTTYTAWYMVIAGLIHGQIAGVKHSAPVSMETFFTGTTNVLFAFGGHAITIEIMHAMWRPRSYKYVYLLTVSYVMTITVPHCIVLYWAFGDELLDHSNALSVLPSSIFRSIALCFMIAHQAIAFGLFVLPLHFMWEKLLGVHQSHYLIRVIARLPVAILLWFLALLFPFFGPLNSIIGSIIMSFSTYIIPCVAYLIVYRTKAARQEAADKPKRWMPKGRGIVLLNWAIVVLIAVLGFGFGSWASLSNLIKQVNTFGVFDKCYQCSSK